MLMLTRIPTFRGAGGLWENHDAMSLATPEAFRADADLVWRFYHYRRKVALSSKPNDGHRALAKLAKTLITQNVDGLSRDLGHDKLLEMHGTIRSAHCTKCKHETDDLEEKGIPPCPTRGCSGVLRPSVVWFGEMPRHLDEIATLLKEADLFLVVGTSSVVYPAAGFARQVKSHGKGKIAVFNLEDAAGDEDADFLFRGPCEETLPKMLEDLL